jgi:tetratricopeptide (TPR) repeat protein
MEAARREVLSDPGDAVLAAALLGGGLPAEAEHHLEAAGLAYQRDDVAERHLREAYAIAPGHAAVLIGLYRFYFYKGRLEEALSVAHACLAKAAADNGLAVDWWQVQRGDADFGNFGASLPRFYLFTLKAYAYLEMRLGNYAEGRLAVLKLLELDPSDKIGAKVLLGVLERLEAPDED